MTKVDNRTFTLTSAGSNFALPAILANPAFGILNSTAVKAHGGTIGPGDTASAYLSQHSAGSGPYVIESVRGTTEVRLRANPLWSGPSPPSPRSSCATSTPDHQLAELRSGGVDVALDLSPGQAAAVGTRPAASQTAPASQAAPSATAPASAVRVTTMRSSSLVYLALGRNPALNAWTANPDFADAVRRGIDRDALGRVASGSTPAAGLIPEGIVGALEDLAPKPGPTAPRTAPAAPGTGTPSPVVDHLPSDPRPVVVRLHGDTDGCLHDRGERHTHARRDAAARARPRPRGRQGGAAPVGLQGPADPAVVCR